MRTAKTILALFISVFYLFVSTSQAANAAFNTGIGRSGTTGLNVSADTPGPIKYHLEFKPLGGTRQVSKNTYDETAKNFSATVNATCLDGAGCTKDETLVRGVYIAGETDGYAVAKKFTLFCGSIQVTGEEKTDKWDDSFYNNFADDFLNNGPSAGNCPSPSPTVAVVTVTPQATATPVISKTAKKSTPAATDRPEQTEEDEKEEPTPTPDEEKDTAVAGFTQNWPAILASLVLFGVLGFVLYKTNSRFRTFIQSIAPKFKRN